MGATATISYKSLKDASSEAKDVSKKLTDYANNLNSAIYNKLNHYSGDYTGNISTAKAKTNSKITALRNKAQAYTNYANDLSDLKEKCVETDRTVRIMVSSLTATFKANNGIRNSMIENTINYVLTEFKNSTAPGRWLNNKSDKLKSIKEYVEQMIEDWWDYQGGKEFITGTLIATLEFAGAVVSVLMAATVGGFGGFLIAAVLLIITSVNFMVNVNNEARALVINFGKDPDPALARRRSNENTLQDTIRRESDSSFLHSIAKGIDIVDGVCKTIQFVQGAGKLIGDGYKWITETGLSEIKNLGKSIKGVNVKSAMNFLKHRGVDFIDNLKNTFDLSKLKGKKNVLSASKDFLKDGLSLKFIRDNFIFKGITVFSTTENGKTNNVTIDKFSGLYEKLGKITEVFKDDRVIPKDVLEKLSSSCDINISIPDVCIPSMELHVQVDV